jgi:hypothetical protein
MLPSGVCAVVVKEKSVLGGAWHQLRAVRGKQHPFMARDVAASAVTSALQLVCWYSGDARLVE